jgi:class 3 adenylate cyclase
MQLSTKLFLFVGGLVLFICLVVYFVPIYLTKKAVVASRQEYISLAEARRAREWEVNNDWLSIQIGKLEGRLDSYLLFAVGHPVRRLDNLFTGNGAGAGAWLAAAQLLATTSEVTFLQAVQGEELAAGLTLSRAQLYAAKMLPIEREIGWVVLDSIPPYKYDLREVFLGIWVPSRIQQQTTASLAAAPVGATEIYLLFDPVALYREPERYEKLLAENKEELEKLKLPGSPRAGQVVIGLIERLDHAAKHVTETFSSEAGMEAYVKEIRASPVQLPLERMLGLTNQPQQVHQSLFTGEVIRRPAAGAESARHVGEEAFRQNLIRLIMRSDDLELVSSLSFLAATGVVGDTPFDSHAPKGATRLMPDEFVGSGVLTRDVFIDNIVYDPVAFFDEHPPVSNIVPIGSTFDLIYSEEIGALTVVNTAKHVVPDEGKPAYLTLGASLFETTLRATHVSGDTVVLLFNGKVVDIIERGDFPSGKGILDQIENHADQFEKKTGFIQLDETDYFYSSYKPRAHWDLQILTFEPAADVLAQIEKFEKDSSALASRISIRILIVAGGLLIVALIILEVIARRFTKPIRGLVAAAETVREGKLEEVKLPDAKGGSRNEVARLSRSFHEMVDGLRDREKVRGVLNKVVSTEIADKILSGKVELGGEVKDATVLFADLRDFSVLTAHLPPEEVITFINGYMTEMTQIIERHQGVVDKYIGDAVMALFGAPVEHQYAQLQAVLSGLLIRNRIKEWNDERKAAGLLTAEVGIGIHSGPMVAGNMGAEDRLNYTVLGANVTLAARISDRAGASEVLITEHVLQNPHVRDTIAVEKCPPVQPKGSAEPVQIYKVIGLKEGNLIEELSDLAAHGERRPQEE